MGCTGGTVGVQLGRENLVGGPEMKCLELVMGLRCSEACASIESSVLVLGSRSVVRSVQSVYAGYGNRAKG